MHRKLYIKYLLPFTCNTIDYTGSCISISLLTTFLIHIDIRCTKQMAMASISIAFQWIIIHVKVLNSNPLSHCINKLNCYATYALAPEMIVYSISLHNNIMLARISYVRNAYGSPIFIEYKTDGYDIILNWTYKNIYNVYVHYTHKIRRMPKSISV